MTAVLSQAQEQMLLFQDLRRRGRLDAAGEKKRLRIALAEGLHQFVPAKQIPIHLAQSQLVIEMQLRFQIFIAEHLAAGFLKDMRKGGEVFLAHR